jgi:hypothetical protein
VECGRDAVGSGGVVRWGVAARRCGEWSVGATWWGAAAQHSAVESGVQARRGGERWCSTVGSGDGGAMARRGGEWSAGAMRWGAVARRCGEWSAGAMRWGAAARHGGEWRW